MKNETKLKIYNLSHRHLVDELKYLYDERVLGDLVLEFPLDLKESNIVLWDSVVTKKLDIYKEYIHSELEKGKILVHIKTNTDNLEEYKSGHVATLEINDRDVTKEEYSALLDQCFQKLHNV